MNVSTEEETQKQRYPTSSNNEETDDLFIFYSIQEKNNTKLHVHKTFLSQLAQWRNLLQVCCFSLVRSSEKQTVVSPGLGCSALQVTHMSEKVGFFRNEYFSRFFFLTLFLLFTRVYFEPVIYFVLCYICHLFLITNSLVY